MGGKNKQSQRTKNNARPSSSSRSAELLTNTAGGLSPFAAAAAAGKPFPTIFPTLKAAVETEQALNAEFMLSVKKLNKKDPITKVKALQELTELAQKSEVDDVVTFLPVWTRLFGQLALDPDHKVRESVQICHGGIVQSAGRRISPHLRSLLPAWVCGARDDHPPAAAAAANTLQSTFPEAKLPEVIAYCKEEMLNYYMENLTGDLDAILANRSLSPEALLQHRTRIILGSLQGIQYVGETLPRAHDDWLQTKLETLYGDKKFWQLTSHEDIRLRSCWFICMSRLIPRGQPKPVLAKLLGVSVDAAKQQDALLSPQVWTCLLLIMTTDKDWYSHIKNKKEFVNRVFDMISNGGWGDARKLCDIILPLLAHLPHEILDHAFYQKFFEALIKGLHKKSILNSKSERQSWITSIGECFRYLSLQNADYTIDVATYTHRAWLEALLKISHDSNIKNHLIKASAINMTSILKYWMKQTENLDKFDCLTRNLWQNLCSTVLKEIDNLPQNNEDISNAIASHTILIQSIQNSFIQEARVKKCIRFDGDSSEQPVATSERNEQCTDVMKDRFNHNLKDFAFKVCCRYLQFAKDNMKCELVLEELMTLIRAFDCKELFESIAHHFEEGCQSVVSLYSNVLMQWLLDENLRCERLVQLVFMMMKYLADNEQEAVFESFNSFPAAVVQWCVSAALQCGAGSSAGAGGGSSAGAGAGSSAGAGGGSGATGAGGAWLCSAAALDGVAALCLRADTLLLTHVQRHDSILPPAAIERMLSTFTEALHHSRSEELEPRVSQAARLVSVLADDDGTRCEGLMMTLFGLLAENQLGKGALTTETWHEVKSACEDVIHALEVDRYSSILADCTTMMHGKIFDRKQDLNIDLIDHLASIYPIFIKKSNTDPESIENIENLTKVLYNFNVNTDCVQFYTLRLDVITSKLNCLFEDDNKFIKKVIETSAESDESELSNVDLILHANKVLFRAAFMKEILKSMEEDGDNLQCNVLLQNDFGVKEFSEILHEYVIFQSLFEGYAFWEHYEIIEKSKKRLEFLLEEVLLMTSHETRNLIGRHLTEQCNTFGYYWAYALRCFKDKCASINPAQASVDTDGNTDSTDQSVDSKVDEAGEKIDELNLDDDDDMKLTGNGYFHFMQAKSNKSEEYSLQLSCKLMIRSLSTAFPKEAKAILLEHSESEIDAVVNAYYKFNYIMLYERFLVTAEYQHVMSNAAILEYLSLYLSAGGWDAPRAHWDFATIALCSCAESLGLDRKHTSTTKVAIIARPLFKLLSVVSRFVSGVAAQSLRSQPSPHVANLPKEWRDIFLPDLYKTLLKLIMEIAASPRSRSLCVPQCVYLQSLTSALPVLRSPPCPFSPAFVSALCASAAQLFASVSHRGYYYLAYYLLTNLEHELLRNDAESVQRWSEIPESADKAPPRLFLHHFTDTFKQLDQLVAASLDHVKVGAAVCELRPHTEVCAISLSALCLHAATLRVRGRATKDLPQHYRNYYQKYELGDEILSMAFKLLPSLDPKELTAYNHAFEHMPDFDLNSPARRSDVWQLSCYVVQSAVTSCAAAAAALSADPAATLCTHVLRETVCPREIQRQLALVQSQRHLLPDTEITIHWSSREVECVHRVEERSVRLSVRLSALHPLQPPQVSADHFNVTWLVVYIAYQNGSLFEGISMWTKMVQSRVESAPQCYICYCRLHPSKGTLPKASCHTCHNKFHADCLQKWFTTSKKSSCPLCRAEFI